MFISQLFHKSIVYFIDIYSYLDYYLFQIHFILYHPRALFPDNLVYFQTIIFIISRQLKTPGLLRGYIII